MIPEDLKYTKQHEWIKIESNTAVFGITDYAQSEMGDITFVELPEKGNKLNQSQTLSTLESVKAASDIYTPLSGQVIEVNEQLANSPELINQSPYEKGWICKIKLSSPDQISGLMDSNTYKEYIHSIKK